MGDGLYHCASRQRRGVFGGVEPGHGAAEEVQAAGHQAAVVLHALQPPPHGIPAVVPGARAFAQQVGDEPVPQGAGEGQDDVPATAEARGSLDRATNHPGGTQTRRSLGVPVIGCAFSPALVLGVFTEEVVRADKEHWVRGQKPARSPGLVADYRCG